MEENVQMAYNKELFEELLETVRSGGKIEITTASKREMSEEEAKQNLRNGIVVLTYHGKSGDGLSSDATCHFDFSQMTWKAEKNVLVSEVNEGEIPKDVADSFVEKAWIVEKMPMGNHITETNQWVQTTEEERYFILGTDTKRLAVYEARFLTSQVHFLRWVEGADEEEPYGTLTEAFRTLLQQLELSNTESDI